MWNEHGPDTRPKSVKTIESKLADAKELRKKLAVRRSELGQLAAQVKAEVQAFGSTWEQIEGNEQALAKLGVLENVQAELKKADNALLQLDAKIPELKAQLTAALDGQEPEAPEATIDDLLVEFEDVTPLEDLSIVEQHARKKELRELFESQP